MKAGKVLCLCVATLFAVTSFVQAGPLADATKDSLWGIEIGGYLEFSSTVNFEGPASDTNTLRVFDTDDSDIVDFNMLNLYFDRLPVDAGDVGFRFDVAVGEDADIIGGDNTGAFSTGDSINIYQAYVSYIAPVGEGLTIDVGRFATWHGYEVIESPMNDQFSRSFLFGLAIPFTHTGIRAGYDFTDMVGASIGVTQGWDSTENVNDSYTVHGALYLNPTEDIFIGNSFAYGAEGATGTPGANSDHTFLWDMVATWQVREQWLLGVNVDYAFQERDALALSDAEWYGFAGYVRYDFRDDMYASVRGEYFNDDDGVRTGTTNEYWEITLTLGYEITDGLLGRVEYRHDDADTGVFENDNGLFIEDSQDTIAFEVIYSF